MNWMQQTAQRMKRAALILPACNGRGAPDNRCRRFHADRPLCSRLLFTRDYGGHSGGWWKNPDYEFCFHLSLSFIDAESGESAPQDRKLAAQWCELFFPGATRLLWAEPPYGELGKQYDVWHYRLFVARDWRTPILPRGEVYSRELTEAGWKSWSELHAPQPELAP